MVRNRIIMRIFTLFVVLVCLFTSGCQKVEEIIDKETEINYYDEAIEPWTYQLILGEGMDVDWAKTSEGINTYNSTIPKDFKEAGVDHVRIRVKDNVDSQLIEHLKTIVSDCLDVGLIPIIAYQADAFKNNPSKENLADVVDWWDKVANEFKETSYLLSFDVMIECSDELNKRQDMLDDMYENVVSKIRETNEKRIIMISPRVRSDPEYLKELKIPAMHNGYLMAEWHFYAAGPSKTNSKKLWTNGTEEEKKLITDKINAALEWQKETKIPTWVGAWMPGNYNDEDDYTIEEQCQFSQYMTESLKKARIPFAVNSDTKFYDRLDYSWYSEMKPVFNAIFN